MKQSILNTFVRNGGRVAAAVAITLMFTSPTWAQNRYVRMHDGRIIRASSTRVSGYVQGGCVVISTLPNNYVADPYAYSNGSPVYYQQTYWHSHNRHWHNDPDGHGRDSHRHSHGHR